MRIRPPQRNPKQLPLHLVIAAADKDAIHQLIEIPRILASHEGEITLVSTLTQFHLAGMSNGAAFRAIPGAGTDEPIAIPFMEVKGLDNHPIRKAIPLDKWPEDPDWIHGFAMNLVDSARQNSDCRHAGGEEKISPVHGCRHGRMIGSGVLNGNLLRR